MAGLPGFAMLSYELPGDSVIGVLIEPYAVALVALN